MLLAMPHISKLCEGLEVKPEVEEEVKPEGLDVKPFKTDEQTFYGDPGLKGTGME